jgi:hypothetical protein
MLQAGDKPGDLGAFLVKDRLQAIHGAVNRAATGKQEKNLAAKRRKRRKEKAFVHFSPKENGVPEKEG